MWFKSRYTVTSVDADAVACDDLFKAFRKVNKKTLLEQVSEA